MTSTQARSAVFGLAFMTVVSVPVPSIATAQRPPPWPQRGDTTVQRESVDQVKSIEYAAGGIMTDTTAWFSTIIGPGGVSDPFTAINTWQAPGPNILPFDGGIPDPVVLTFNPQRWLLTTCDVPLIGTVDCRTGASLVAKTWGAAVMKVGFPTGISAILDTVHYHGMATLTLPAPGSFAPGDTVPVGVDVELLEQLARIDVQVGLDSLQLWPALEPLSYQVSLRTCVLGNCSTRTATSDAEFTDTAPTSGEQISWTSLEGDTLTVTRPFDPTPLPGRGIIGDIRVPEIALTEARVDAGRSLVASGRDTYASFDWDLEQFLCGYACLTKTFGYPTGVNATVTVMELEMSAALGLEVEFTVTPAVTVSLDLNGQVLSYLEWDSSGTIVRSATDSVVTFALGNTAGLIIPDSPGAAGAFGLTVSPSIDVGIDTIGYRLRHVTGPVGRDLLALRTRVVIPRAEAFGGLLTFGGVVDTLGPAYDADIPVTDSAVAVRSGQFMLSEYADSADRWFHKDLQAVTLTPERPGLDPAFTGSTLSAAGGATATLGSTTAAAGFGDILAQAIAVANTGNVHLADFGVDYQLRSTTPDAVLAAGDNLAAREYLSMLDLSQVTVPLALEAGREYRLGVTAHAKTPIGTAISTTADLAIGMFAVDLTPPGTGIGSMTATVQSSPELDARRIDPASVTLAGVAPAGSRWTGTAGSESLVLTFPAPAVLAAAKAAMTAELPRVTSDAMLGTLLGDGESLTATEVELLDRYGNGNGRLDLGDVRTDLVAAGALPADGTAAVGSDPDLPTTVPVRLLLGGVMDQDQRAYGVGILLLSEEGS